MRIGVPKEIKDQERRVGLTPDAVRRLRERGHEILIQAGAGEGAGFKDIDYKAAGAKLVVTAEAAWDADLIIKVKEPLPTEYGYLRRGQLLFTYLHLAANRELTVTLMQSGVTAIAYEAVEETQNGQRHFPLLTPMSKIAGRLAVQFGARFLESPQGGRGVLLAGIPGVAPGRVLVLGAGVVGTEAVRMAVGLGARVTVLDINVERLYYLETLFGDRVEYLYSTPELITYLVPLSDLVIGAVLVPGQRPPCLVPEAAVSDMPLGAVIVDVTVDQGGCVETIRPTTHSRPVYSACGVLHCGVPNLPAAVPRTATQALTNSTWPYILCLADHGDRAFEFSPALAKGLVVKQHHLVHPDVRVVFPDL
ncbi:alanine dehydrogenase [Thermosynechococcus sichuanensis E542]|uniref:Alanine dehydrogenase n=1 Tax=Thermosynechococcus sichuanensis E542 TaxID=2016101 RepID=A0A7D6J2R6_9CYAN|nr:alanine dehydrogenase [Thermosynechococcus vestitus]QLL29174.1 alanine dehydrogenase [Thermosynechococcus vestitus E542]